MIRQLWGKYQNNQKFKQVITLLSVNVIVIPLSIVSSIIITRFLGAAGFGDFKYLIYLFNLGVILFNLGFFHAGNRVLVLTDDTNKAREVYGAELIILGMLFLIMILCLVGYALVDNNIKEKGLQIVFIWTLPVAWIFLLSRYFEVLFQADNKINLLAKSRLYPKVGFFIAVLVLYLVYDNYSHNRLNIIWFLFMVTQILGFLYIIKKINPSFNNIGIRVKEILHYNKSYGFNVYLGSLFSTGFTNLTGILISYFGIDNSGVGYYGLALTIAGTLEFIPNVIGTTHFKDFSNKESIPRKLFMTTLGLSFVALVLTLLLVGPFIRFFYGAEFLPVISLTYIVSFGVILTGFADFLNRFLGSHGRGKALRNSAIIVGFATMVLNILLIPSYGEKGAAYVNVSSGVIYFLIMLWFYRKLVLDLKKGNIK